MASPPHCKDNGEDTENDENNTSCCSDKEKTGAAKHRIIEAQTAMSPEVQHSHALRGGGGGEAVAGQ